MKLRPMAVAAACVAAAVLLAKADFAAPPPVEAANAEVTQTNRRTPAEYCRAPDNTFLTYPEWYLVYSPREYARFISTEPPSRFPYLGHVGQLWRGYWAIYQATRYEYPFNLDYHVMIWVISTSTTAEYGLKWIYETVVGRAAEITRGNDLTEEDLLAADVAQEYVDFLDIEPWYKFDFLDPLRRLWTGAAWWGPHMVRRWERKYFLTSEYLAKAAYGWLIKKSSESSYGVESPLTAVVLDRAPPAAAADVHVLEKFSDGAVLATLPRYQAFTRTAVGLAQSGVKFLEIAGNVGPVLVTLVVPEGYEPTGSGVLFEQPIMTQPGRKRIALTVPVTELSDALVQLHDRTIEIEHVYDF